MASSRTVNTIEKERLAEINDRTICVRWRNVEKLDFQNRELFHLLCDLDLKQQSLINHWKTSNVFVVFSDFANKRDGVDWIEKSGAAVEIDYRRKFIPVSADELEDSRDDKTLAVHGVPYKTRVEEILELFPKAEVKNINCKKGGSIFLSYRSEQSAVQDFIRHDQVLIQNMRCVLMFSHNRSALEETRERPSSSSSYEFDLRHKIDGNSHNRAIWDDLVSYVMDNIGAEGDRSPDLDSLDFSSLLDMFENSDLTFYQMKHKVEITESKVFEVRVKTEWMDQLLMSIIKCQNLPGNRVKNYPRGWIRDIVENSWRFFHRSQSGTSKRQRRSRSPDDKTTRYDVYNEEIKDYKRMRRISQSPSGSQSTSRSPPHSDLERGTRYSPQSPDSDSRDFNRNSNVQDKNGNKNSDADMFIYLTDSLTRLGLERKKAEKVSNKIVNCLVELVDNSKARTVTTSQLSRLLEESGFKLSEEVSSRQAAELVIDFMNADKGNDSDKTAQVKSSSSKVPDQLRKVEEGFPRMAVVMAYFLHNFKGYREEVAKDLARSMVSVWICYGFQYSDLWRICCSTSRNSQKQHVLKGMLLEKVKEGKEEPKEFQFNSLIELTIRYFLKAV